jgi:hypothetical protein
MTIVKASTGAGWMAKGKVGRPVAAVSYHEYWYEEVDAEIVSRLSFLERDDLKFHSIVKWESVRGSPERTIQFSPAHVKALLKRLDEAEDKLEREVRSRRKAERECRELLEKNLGLNEHVAQQYRDLKELERRKRTEDLTRASGGTGVNSIERLKKGATKGRGKKYRGGLPGQGKRS